jgi:hypothetical protein
MAILKNVFTEKHVHVFQVYNTLLHSHTWQKLQLSEVMLPPMRVLLYNHMHYFIFLIQSTYLWSRGWMRVSTRGQRHTPSAASTSGTTSFSPQQLLFISLHHQRSKQRTNLLQQHSSVNYSQAGKCHAVCSDGRLEFSIFPDSALAYCQGRGSPNCSQKAVPLTSGNKTLSLRSFFVSVVLASERLHVL